MQHAFVYILAQPPTACRNIIIRLVELVNACRCGVWSFVPFTISAEAVDTSSWPPAVGGNSHQPWVMSPAGAPAVGSLATERFAAKCSNIFGLFEYIYIHCIHSYTFI